MLRHLNAAILALSLFCAQSSAADQSAPPGCRLAADDPLRLEVNRMMKQGAEFEEQQKAALQDKVSALGRARGWSKTQEDAYLRRVVLVGNNESWDRTLSLAAAFIRVCEEQTDGNQRAEAVRLFRELYLVEEKQWRSIHDAVDMEIAAARQEPPN